jgi:lysophospholipase L1-like esterase
MPVDRICFFGDSLTIGDSDSEGLSWPGRLCRPLRAGQRGVTCYNLGINGDTARDIARRWEAEAVARARDGGPGALVFCFGVNDASTIVGRGPQVPLAESRKCAEAILVAAQRMAPPLLIAPPPIDERVNPMVEGEITWDMRNATIQAYGEAYAEIATRLGVPWLDIHTPLLTDARYQAALAAVDGVHPAADGCARIAELVAAWPEWQALTA